ncbi:MAG: serine--tRNA ligase [Candidatus Micrarchaeia archaeon]
MLDIKAIRANPQSLRDALAKRGAEVALADQLLGLDEEWRKKKAELDALKASKNRISLEIAEIKKKGGKADAKLKELADLPKRIAALEAEVKELEAREEALLLVIPNIPHASVPVGKENVEVRRQGKPSEFDFEPKAHYELGEKLGMLNFDKGAKLAGHRFCVMRGKLARLERAVTAFFLDVATERGYIEHWTPYLVNQKTMQGTGQLPKFEEELYKCERDGLYLIPTAEVTLTNLHAGEILEEKVLPLNYCAFTPCFRREAGAYGKDIKGMLRQHQFDKVELVKITKPEESYSELERMVADAEETLKRLGLPYRVVELCASDLGFASAKTFDLEVWIPSQRTYREISSISNCTDFQARRMGTRFWRKGKPEFVHTLNGSGVAVGRAVIAIMENFQNEDGSITVPDALRKYMGEITEIA